MKEEAGTRVRQGSKSPRPHHISGGLRFAANPCILELVTEEAWSGSECMRVFLSREPVPVETAQALTSHGTPLGEVVIRPRGPAPSSVFQSI